MATFGSPTRSAVTTARWLVGGSSWGDVVARVGKEFFLDEKLRSLSGDSVATRGRVVGTTLLILQVKDCWRGAAMFPESCVHVECNFDNIVGAGKVLPRLVEVCGSFAFRRASCSSGLKVIRGGLILTHGFLKVRDLHVVDASEVGCIRWILSRAREAVPGAVEEGEGAASRRSNSVSDVRV